VKSKSFLALEAAALVSSGESDGSPVLVLDFEHAEPRLCAAYQEHVRGCVSCRPGQGCLCPHGHRLHECWRLEVSRTEES
jgi:hypothetical protein